MMLTVSLDTFSEEISNFTDLPVNSLERSIKGRASGSWLAYSGSCSSENLYEASIILKKG